jgi:hypothetical protein
MENPFKVTDVSDFSDDVFFNLQTLDQILTKILPFMVFSLDVIQYNFLYLNQRLIEFGRQLDVN